MAFDPDAFLAQDSGGFDPDAFLAETTNPTLSRDQILSQVTQNARPNDPIADFLQGAKQSRAGQALTGVGQSAANSLLGVANLMNPGVKEQAKGLLGEAGISIDPKTGIEKGGKIIGDIVQFMAPGAAVAKLGKATSSLPFFSRANVANLGLKGLAEGLTGAGVSAVQQGKIDDTVRNVGLTGAFFPTALKTIGSLSKTAVSTTGKIGTIIGERILRRSVFDPKLRHLEDGFDMKTLVDEGIRGNSQATFRKAISDRIKELKVKSESLLQGEQTFSKNEFISKVLERGRELISKKPAVRGEISKSLDNFVKNIVKGLPDEININQMDDIRASFGELSEFRSITPTIGVKERTRLAKEIWRISKDTLEKNISKGEELNSVRKRLSKLYPMLNAITRNSKIKDNNLLIGLSDTIFASGGFLSGVSKGSLFDPTFMIPIIMNHAQRSPWVGSLLNKAGRVMENPEVASSVLNNFLTSTAKESAQLLTNSPTDSQEATIG